MNGFPTISQSLSGISNVNVTGDITANTFESSTIGSYLGGATSNLQYQINSLSATVAGFINYTGNTGNTGVAGATGCTGVTGYKGNTGHTGNTGVTGATGCPGQNGVAGTTGCTGLQGLTGTTGATGVTGTTGTQGATGNTGNTGATGVVGKTGATGTTGVTGVTGCIGPTPIISIGSVSTSTSPNVSVDSASTPNNVILDFVLPQNNAGDILSAVATALASASFVAQFAGAILALGNAILNGTYSAVNNLTIYEELTQLQNEITALQGVTHYISTNYNTTTGLVPLNTNPTTTLTNDINLGSVPLRNTSPVIYIDSINQVLNNNGATVLAGGVTCGSNLVVSGTTVLTGGVSCGSNLVVSGASVLTGSVTCGSNLVVSGASVLTGNIICGNSLTVNGNITTKAIYGNNGTMSLYGTTLNSVVSNSGHSSVQLKNADSNELTLNFKADEANLLNTQDVQIIVTGVLNTIPNPHPNLNPATNNNGNMQIITQNMSFDDNNADTNGFLGDFNIAGFNVTVGRVGIFDTELPSVTKLASNIPEGSFTAFGNNTSVIYNQNEQYIQFKSNQSNDLNSFDAYVSCVGVPSTYSETILNSYHGTHNSLLNSIGTLGLQASVVNIGNFADEIQIGTYQIGFGTLGYGTPIGANWNPELHNPELLPTAPLLNRITVGTVNSIVTLNGGLTTTGSVNFTVIPTSSQTTPPTDTQFITKGYGDSHYGGTTILGSNNSWSGHNYYNTYLPSSTLTPASASDLVTKTYVDSSFGIIIGTNAWTNRNSFNTYLPTSTVTPASASDLVTKTYVDGKFGIITGTNAWTNTNTFNTYLPSSTVTPVNTGDLVTKTYCDTKSNALLTSNNTWTGTNAFNTSLPTSSVTPSGTSDLVTKTYCDTALLASNNTWTGTNLFNNYSLQTDNTSYNVGVGYQSLHNGYSNCGLSNIGIGYQAGYNCVGTTTSNQHNILLGSQSGYNLASGCDHNIMIGQQAGYNASSSASNCIYIGQLAGYNNTNPTENVCIGSCANQYQSGGSQNVIIGSQAGFHNSGYQNTYLGFMAGAGGSGGSNGYSNVFIGPANGFSITSGNYNVSSGDSACYSITSGSGNTCFGTSSGQNITTSGYSTCIGYNAGFSNNTSNNTFVGGQAGYNCNAGQNTFVGWDCGFSATSGTDNTIMGDNASYALTTGGKNTIIGSASASLLTSGDNNVVMGYQTGTRMTSGRENTLLGINAGNYLSSGHSNTFVGAGAGNWTPISTYSNCTAIGYNAGTEITGDNQVVIGTTAEKVILPNTISLPNVPMVYCCLDIYNATYVGSTTYITSVSGQNAICIASNSVGVTLCFNYYNIFATTGFNQTGYNKVNGRFTPAKAGFYQLSYQIFVNSCTGGTYSILGNFYKGSTGVTAPVLDYQFGSSSGQVINQSIMFYFNGSTDYFFVSVNNSSGAVYIGGSNPVTWFQGIYLHS